MVVYGMMHTVSFNTIIHPYPHVHSHTPTYPRTPNTHTQTEQRYAELAALGIKVQLVCIGKKGATYFKRRPQYDIASMCSMCVCVYVWYVDWQ